MLNCFSNELEKGIGNASLLLVGAGGIGCEVLKNLVMVGFRDIHVIDLDTIDVSNLNRQFLFQRRHVSQAKSVVACEAARQFCPDAKLVPYHDSVIKADYGVPFFRQFDLVLNALDNRAARSHVNRLCLAAGVPLLESGTAGYLGQVTVIRKGVTECYECQPKATQKTFPGCTIRNTPSEPIHCIVWAKHLFNQLFGEADPDEDVSPDTADPELAGDTVGTAALHASSHQQDENADTGGSIVAEQRVSTRAWAQQHNYNCQKLFQKLFCDDIKYLLSMDKLWQKRRPPQPLDYHELTDAAPIDEVMKNGGGGVGLGQIGLSDQSVWTPAECVRVLETSVARLKQALSEVEGDAPALVWDKDDAAGMDFVTACANLRAHCFGIVLNSRFTIKSMAGNIIPAIATTNAIIAGLLVLEAFKLLENRAEHCRTLYLNHKPNVKKRLIVPCALDKPNPNCYVCTDRPEVTVTVNIDLCTPLVLQTAILCANLQMSAPDVELADGRGGVIIISSEPGETDAIQKRTLRCLGVRHGSRLVCDDFLQNYQLVLNVKHDASLISEDMFEVTRQGDVGPSSSDAQPSTSAQPSDNSLPTMSSSSTTDQSVSTVCSGDGPSAGAQSHQSSDDSDSDDLVCLSDVEDGTNVGSNNGVDRQAATKRSLSPTPTEDTDTHQPPNKRSKLVNSDKIAQLSSSDDIEVIEL